MKYDVIIIGGGATGTFTALDLSLRGIKVALVERNSLASGTTGKYHGMLHSGARYAVNDPVSAKECIEENKILTSIAPHTIVDTGGIFVSLTEEELDYQEKLEKGLKATGIPYKELNVEDLLKEEKNLNMSIKSAIWVPDKVMYAHDLIFSVVMTASINGAMFFPFREVKSLKKEGSTVTGVKVLNKIRNMMEEIDADLIVNAAGPWSGKIAQMAGVEVEIMPTAGVMGVTEAQLVRHIVNRMRLPSDGDIIIPYTSNVSITGTTATLIEDPDNFSVQKEELELLLNEGSMMVPKLKEFGFKRYYASIRPLLKVKGESAKTGREASRTFDIFDHEKDGIHGIVTISGGKFTTSRLMAEKISDLVSEKFGIKEKSKTAKTKLLGANISEDAEVIAKVSGLDYSFVKKLMDTIGTVDEERFRPALLMLLSHTFSEVR
jgi:glycerol-3-phosphate dehydrogenase